MAPSNTLSSTDASRFGLQIVEPPIVLDYLIETRALIRALTAPQAQLFHDWWDTGRKRDYVAMLTRRHPQQTDKAALTEDKRLPWPDISTFEGLSPALLAGGDVRSVLRALKGTRNEFYDIKPNSKTGERDGLLKVEDVARSYVKHGLRGVYVAGRFYPQLGRKTIQLQAPLVAIFRYLMRLLLPKLGVQLIAIELEVERKYPGVLLYRICVTFKRDDDWDQARELDWYVANFCVRNLLRTHTIGKDASVKALAMTFADALEPVDGIPPGAAQPFVARGIDFAKAPALRLRKEVLADELAGALPTIRDTMYSRLIGRPGERYFLCGDEAYYRHTILAGAQSKVANQIALLGLAGATKAAAMSTMLGILPAVGLSVADVMQESPQMMVDLVEYVRTHPKEVLIGVGIAVAVTALLIVTAGGAAPVVAGGLAATEGGLAIAAAEGGLAVAAAETTVAGTGMAASLMSEAGMAGAATAALPDAVVLSGAAEGSLATFANTVAAEGVSAAEVAEAGAERAAQQLLIRILQEEAIKAALKRAAVGAASLVGGAGVIALSARPAYAAAPSRGAGGPVAPNDLTKLLALPPLGRLFVLPVMKALPYGVTRTPALYAEFDMDTYVADVPLGVGTKPRGKARLLGILNAE